MQWIASGLTENLSTQGLVFTLVLAPCSYSGAFWRRFLKKGAFTLVPSEYHGWTPRLGTKCTPR